MQIVIDTQKDSRDDIRKAIVLLESIVQGKGSNPVKIPSAVTGDLPAMNDPTKSPEVKDGEQQDDDADIKIIQY